MRERGRLNRLAERSWAICLGTRLETVEFSATARTRGRSSVARHGESGCDVFVSSVAFHIRLDKQAEFLASIKDLMERTRWIKGCFGCRLVAELGEFQAVTLVAEWGDRDGLDRFLQSHEYRIMLGMRILTLEEPRVTVDEVTTRARLLTREPR